MSKKKKLDCVSMVKKEEQWYVLDISEDKEVYRNIGDLLSVAMQEVGFKPKTDGDGNNVKTIQNPNYVV